MTQYLLPAIVNGIGVTLGLYLLWTVTRWLPPGRRIGPALLAGLVSAVVGFVVPVVITAASS